MVRGVDLLGEKSLMGLDLIRVTSNKVRMIRDRLQTTQSRQKKYADKRRHSLEFVVGENVFLKVSLTKGIFKFRKKGKLSPRFIKPFEILKKVGAVAYKLALSPNLSAIHMIFPYIYAEEASTRFLSCFGGSTK